MAEFIHQTGVLIVKDPRVTFQDNEVFINTMEKYFEQTAEAKLEDAYPDIHYQVGSTPQNIEVPRCTQEPNCLERIAKMEEEDRAHAPSGSDPKERFFWRIGERPTNTKFAELNAAPVIPKAFAESWSKVMDTWGEKMLTAVTTVAQMLSLGLGLGLTAFSDRMHQAPHLLAPTGTDLSKFGELDTIIAGFHYDLSFLTIHGKSRFPGLYVWLRTGKKVLVRVPDGCLLVQAGKQLEILTAGYILAGDHEVVCSKETVAAIEKAKQEPGRSLWRVSSTLFSHIASDVVLQPLGKFADDPKASSYTPILAGDQVSEELKAISLAKK